MALIYCIEHGVFVQEEHDALLRRYEAVKSASKNKRGGVGASPGKTKAASAAAVPGVKKPRASAGGVLDSSAVAVDVGMSIGGETRIGGAMTL